LLVSLLYVTTYCLILENVNLAYILFSLELGIDQIQNLGILI